MFPPRFRAVGTIFLDRDGTITVKPPEGAYVTSPSELSLLPGAAHAIARFNAVGLPTVLVTNQRWLSWTPGNSARYAAIHARLEQLLADQGAHLDAAYCCPHAAAACDCRKPNPGMLQRAAEEHGFSLANAVMIGDSDTDIAAGRSAGTATILLRAGEASTALNANADAVADDLPAAAQLILARGSSPARVTPASWP